MEFSSLEMLCQIQNTLNCTGCKCSMENMECAPIRRSLQYHYHRVIATAAFSMSSILNNAAEMPPVSGDPASTSGNGVADSVAKSAGVQDYLR